MVINIINIIRHCFYRLISPRLTQKERRDLKIKINNYFNNCPVVEFSTYNKYIVLHSAKYYMFHGSEVLGISYTLKDSPEKVDMEKLLTISDKSVTIRSGYCCRYFGDNLLLDRDFLKNINYFIESVKEREVLPSPFRK